MPEGTNASQVRLICKGKPLLDNSTLRDAGVKDGALVMMTLELAGGGSNGESARAAPIIRPTFCRCVSYADPLCPVHRAPGKLGQSLVRQLYRCKDLHRTHCDRHCSMPVPPFPARNGASVKDFARTVKAFNDRWSNEQARWDLAFRELNVVWELHQLTQADLEPSDSDIDSAVFVEMLASTLP